MSPLFRFFQLPFKGNGVYMPKYVHIIIADLSMSSISLFTINRTYIMTNFDSLGCI